jgi:hypothetical protein
MRNMKLGDRNRNPSPIGIIGNLTLMEGWTSINPDRTFINQRFDLRPAIKTSRIERNGRLSVTCRPMKITWYGGRSEDLKGVTHVKIVTGDSAVVDEALNTRRSQPEEVAGGVSFEVMAE